MNRFARMLIVAKRGPDPDKMARSFSDEKIKAVSLEKLDELKVAIPPRKQPWPRRSAMVPGPGRHFERAREIMELSFVCDLSQDWPREGSGRHLVGQ